VTDPPHSSPLPPLPPELSGDLMAQLLALLPLGVHAKDPRQDLRYVLWNDAMTAITRLPAKAVLGRSDAEIFPAHVARLHRDDDREVIESGRPLRRDGTVSRSSAPGHVMNVQKLPLRDASGAVALVVTLVEDVTERRRLERQVQHAQKMEAVSRLAGGIAHDFNNLLQVIMGYGELLRGDLPAGHARQDLERMLQAGRQAGSLVDQLLSVSRQERPLSSGPVDLDALVDRLQRVLRRVIGEDIALQWHPATGLPPAEADAAQLEQLLLDLCVNARDAMPHGGTLTLRTFLAEIGAAAGPPPADLAPGRYAGIAVSDTGVGVPADLQATIFEPFFTTKEVGRGSGLGLAVAYAVTRAHGGGITVESRPGEGATFVVYLPVAKAAADASPGRADLRARETTEPAATPASPGPAARPAGRILVAEDQDAVRDLCVKTLERAGHTVVPARDGAEAVERWAEAAEPFDLLLLDVRMPGLDGGGALAAIRARGGMTPALFCSGYQDQEIPAEALAQAAGPVLHKPYAADVLLGRVAEVLAAARGEDAGG
jgi:PAS domain S-box-containing protein